MIENLDQKIQMLQDELAALKKLRPATFKRLNIAVPTTLIQQARSAKVNISKICSQALQDHLVQPVDYPAVTKKSGQTTRSRVTVSVPERLNQQIREAKKHDKIVVSKICSQAIQDYLTKLERTS